MTSRDTLTGVPRSILLLFVVVLGCAGGDSGSPGASGLADSATDGSTGPASTAGSSTSGTTAEPSASASASGPTTTAPDPDTTAGQSDASTSGGGDESSSSGGEPATLRRYSLDMGTGTWTSAPLDELWASPNAPPSTGIAAAVSFTHFDRLFVTTNDGMVYERADRVWQTPVPLDERFPAAGDLQVTAMVHTPGQDTDDHENIFFIDAPTAVVYDQFENGGLELLQVADLMDNEGGAPQASVDNDWSLALADPSGIGMDADWLRWYSAYANGELWLFNAAFEWTLFPVSDNLFFTGAAGEPDPFAVRAAYYDDTFAIAHFIAP